MSAAVWAAAGAAIGAGVWMCAYAARRVTLVEALTARPATPRATPPQGGGWAQRWGRAAVPLLADRGVPGARMRRALALADRDVDAYRAEKAAAAAVGAVLALGMGVGAAAAGLPALLGVAAALGAGCFLAPDAAVWHRAREHRAQLRIAASMLADLAVIGLAGGAGITGALAEAARRGQGWAPGRIRLALQEAAVTQQPSWQALGDLGRQTGVAELEEVAAACHLAGADGARVKNSLAAKAAGLRARETTRADAAAQAATERMAMPVMLLVMAFMVLIGFPALAHVLTGF